MADNTRATKHSTIPPLPLQNDKRHASARVSYILFFVLTFALLVFLTAPISHFGAFMAINGDSSKLRAQVLAPTHFTFTAPVGIFLPSLSTTDPATFDPTTTNFGLVSDAFPKTSDSSLTAWQHFAAYIARANAEAPTNVMYKVLFLSRHGQGYHNLAETYYGTPAWNCHYSALPGDPTSNISWTDARLSKLGMRQARAQSDFWRHQITREKMPAPRAWFVSPMERACRTAEITFEPLHEDGLVGFQPVVKEKLREENGIHTCDMRSPRRVITANYPQYDIEDDFTEEDELWDAEYRETHEAHTARVLELLDDVFNSHAGRDATFVSMVAHGGAINAILRAVGHREFQVRVGSAIAVFVRMTEVDGARERYSGPQGARIPSCENDPLKAGLPGYKSFGDYVDQVESSVS